VPRPDFTGAQLKLKRSIELRVDLVDRIDRFRKDAPYRFAVSHRPVEDDLTEWTVKVVDAKPIPRGLRQRGTDSPARDHRGGTRRRRSARGHYEDLEAFRQRFRDEGKESEEEIIMDVMDLFHGLGRPSLRV
jgi:hypothetical protein